MRPYFAILYDSLLESVSSRVLWILLFGWTLILAALFPLSLSEGESFLIGTGDINKPKLILDQLAAASAGKGTRAQRSVYAVLDENFQKSLQDRQKSGRKIQVGLLASVLSDALKSESLFDKDAFPKAERRKELKALIEKDSLSSDERQRLNRQLIELAFPNTIRSGSAQSTWITYGGMRFVDPIPLTARQVRPFIETGLLPVIMWIGLGMVAMIVSVVITSPMIPDMFQTGSLHLLLSKPLSRSFLYLSKYMGGCIFVAFNIAYLVIGLYLFAGIQLGIWNRGILWCIPLFIFFFMIFYSVSALVGIVWKNPIICVVVTALFWGACFTVGLIRNITEAFLKGPPTLQRLVVVGGSPVVGNQQGRIQFWNETTKTWKTAYGDVDGQRVIGPIWSQEDETLYFGRVRFTFGFATGDNARLELAKLPELIGKEASKDVKPIWDDSRLDSGPDLPTDTDELIPWGDAFLAVSPSGISAFDSKAASRADENKIEVFGFKLGNAAKDLSYRIITDNSIEWQKPIDVAADWTTKRIVVYARGKLYTLKREKEIFSKDAELDLKIPSDTVVRVDFNEYFALVCPHAQAPMLVDLTNMQVVSSFEELGKPTMKRIAVAKDGRIAVLTVDGDVWVMSKDGEKMTRPNVVGQGEGTTIQFDETGKLWVAHHTKQVDVWNEGLSGSVKSYRPARTVPEFIFDFIINPFYLVNPKPTAVNETIQYLLRNPENKLPMLDRTVSDIPQIERDPWMPIWTNCIFIGVMLSLGCWYLHRQDL